VTLRWATSPPKIFEMSDINNKSAPQQISESTIRRLSLYHRDLLELEKTGKKTISSQQLAELRRITPAQVRKDLSFFGAFGTRGLGYTVGELRKRIGEILGRNRRWNVAVVGAGKIGAALAGFKEFEGKGFDIKLIADNDQRKIGSKQYGITVTDVRNLQNDIATEEIEIVILAVPAKSAQEITDIVVSSGVRAILSFAPVNIKIPENIHIRTEDMTMELEYLTYALVNGK